MTIGEKLKEARQKLGISIQQAQADLKIRSVHLEALESDSFDRLPGEAYVRAFLRSYSQYLGLNPDDIIREYETIHLAKNRVEGETDTAPGMSRYLKAVLVLAAAVILLTAVWLAIPQREPVPTIPPAPIEQQSSGSVTTAPAAPQETTGEVEPPPVAEPYTIEVRITGEESCWVKIRTESGDILVARTLSPGENTRVETTQTVTVQLGNPAAATVYLNDRLLTDFPLTTREVTLTASGVQR